MSETPSEEEEDVECVITHSMFPFQEAIKKTRLGNSSINVPLIDEWILDKDSQYLAKVLTCLIRAEKHHGGYLRPPSNMMPLLP